MGAARRWVTVAAIAVATTLTVPTAVGAWDVPTPRIVGGSTVDHSTTPWFVKLDVHIDGDGPFLCGGTAIAANWIVTAAHCVTDEVTGQPLSGTDRIRSRAYVNPTEESPEPWTGLRWSEVVIHPNYDSVRTRYDIALIKTETPMSTTTLPYSADPSSPAKGSSLQVFGWGQTSFQGPFSRIFRKVDLTDLAGPAGSCGKYGKTYDSATMLCAGVAGGGRDACLSDSGGPLTTVGTPRRLVGIVSFGERCAEADYPGVYTRVSTVAGWIQSRTGIAPDGSSVTVRAPAAFAVQKPCRTRACKVFRPGKLVMKISNGGGQSGTWQVKARKLRVSRTGGTLVVGQTVKVKVKTKNWRANCGKVTVRSDSKVVKTYQVRVNGGRCRV